MPTANYIIWQKNDFGNELSPNIGRYTESGRWVLLARGTISSVDPYTVVLPNYH